MGPVSRNRQDSTVEQKGSEGWATGIPRAAGLRPSLILCLPDELFQKVAEDYVSVAAFQVMTGVYFFMVPSPLGDLLDPPT